jgi:poly(3-hydroxybutyrate) depolymerase
MVKKMVSDHGVDRTRVFVTGLSAGGAMTPVFI